MEVPLLPEALPLTSSDCGRTSEVPLPALPSGSAIPLLGIYPEKTIIQKDTCTPIFIAALFTIARKWK